jgi:hypothetical protein
VSSGGSFATLTHARLRASQGDVAGAVRILRVILSVQPDHEDARALLAGLEDRVTVRHREPDDKSGAAVRVLSGWLARVQRNRGLHHAQ